MISLFNRTGAVCVITALIIVLCHAQVKTLFSEWRPNSDTGGLAFIGSKACVECHPKQAAYLSTPMAQALEVAPDCSIVTRTKHLTFRNGSFTYEVSREASTVTYTVTDGVNRVKEPILYCFGRGHVGQTYVFRHNGLLYETRVSYFENISGLDFTIGHRQSVPNSLEEALGRTIGDEEQRQCFGCHTTGAVNGLHLRLDRLAPGVACEACHGPGEKHAIAMKEKKTERAQIFNPRNLGALDLSQSFCGSCHTSFEMAMLMPGQSGINNIRFQPYRMFNSSGHNTNDVRTGCLACHNPHEQLVTEPAYYDSKCLACHLTTRKDVKTERRNAAACPVSTKNCVTCHMPKVELPGMHAAFTDHWIRIAKPGSATPR